LLELNYIDVIPIQYVQLLHHNRISRCVQLLQLQSRGTITTGAASRLTNCKRIFAQKNVLHAGDFIFQFVDFEIAGKWRASARRGRRIFDQPQSSLRSSWRSVWFGE
jgi:hypothetical protein